MKLRLKLAVAIAIPAVLFLIYCIVGFLIVPAIAPSLIGNIASDKIAGSIEVKRLSLNPLSFRAELSEFVLKDTDGNTIAGFETAVADIDPIATLFGDEIRVPELILGRPFADVVIAEDGSINILDAVRVLDPAPPEEPREPIELPMVWIGEIAMQNGRVSIDDRVRGIARQIEPIEFRTVDFRTAPDVLNELRFSLETDATERIDLTSTLQFNPLTIAGKVDVGFRLDGFKPVVDPLLNFFIEGGEVTLSLGFLFDPLGDDPKVGVGAMRVGVGSTVLRAKGDTEPFFAFDQIDVAGVAADLISGEASVESVGITGVQARAKRLADGSIDLVPVLTPNLPATPEESEPVEPEPVKQGPREPVRIGVIADGRDPGEAVDAVLEAIGRLTPESVKVLLGELSVSESAFRVTDEAVDPSTKLNIDAFTFNLANVTNTHGEEAPLTVAFELNESGRVEVDGAVTPLPTAAGLNFNASGIELPIINAYLAEALPALSLGSGTARVNGRIDAALTDNPLPDIKLTVEEAGIDAFRLFEVVETDEPVAAFEALSVKGISASLEPLSVTVSEVMLLEPFARVERLAGVDDEPGQLAPLTWLPTAAPTEEYSPKTDPKPERPEADSPPIIDVNTLKARLDRFVIENAELRILDRDVDPAVDERVSEIGLNLEDVVLGESAPARLTVTGRIAGEGQFEVTASAIPADPYASTSLALNVRRVPLRIGTPYVVDLIGRPITGGNAEADLSVSLKNGFLDVGYDAGVRTMRFGDAVPGKGTLNLPIPLETGVILLEDASGLLRIPKVPVSGYITENPPDPSKRLKIDFVAALADASRQMFLTAATSPFSLLGKTLGPGGEEIDLSRIEFEPGSAELTEESREILARLADALRKKPSLNVAIEPLFDRVEDRRAASNAMLEERIDAAMKDEGRPMSRQAAVSSLFKALGGASELLDRSGLANSTVAKEPTETQTDDTEHSEAGSASEIPENDRESIRETAVREIARLVGRQGRRIILTREVANENGVEKKFVETTESIPETGESRSESPKSSENPTAGAQSSGSSVAEMEDWLRKQMPVETSTLRDFAAKRREAVVDYLTELGIASQVAAIREPRPGEDPQVRFDLAE